MKTYADELFAYFFMNAFYFFHFYVKRNIFLQFERITDLISPEEEKYARLSTQ